MAAIVIEHVENMIVAGRLVPGQRLVEDDLAKATGVGRVPVREALRRLAGDGVVEIVPNRGARLRHLEARDLADILKVLVGLLFVALDEFPTIPPAVDKMRNLRRIQAEIESCMAKADGTAVIAGAGAYQRELIRLSGNLFLMELIDAFHFRFYASQFSRTVPYGEVHRIGGVYAGFNEALARDDVRAVKAALQESVARALDFLK